MAALRACFVPFMTFFALSLIAPGCLCLLVPSSPLTLAYHNGPLLSSSQPLHLYITFYGHFTPLQRLSLSSFLASLSPPQLLKPPSLRASLIASILEPPSPAPSVSNWWSLTRLYKDLDGRHVSQNVILKAHRTDLYSLGKSLTSSDIRSLVHSSLDIFPAHDAVSMHLVFTAADVLVEGFCMHSCGGHSHIELFDQAAGVMLPYAWVGNSESQCPGYCAWPFARPEYGPPAKPLQAPNEMGVDGMIITLAKVLAGAATNPFGNAYYQGEATNALEAGGACTGTFGAGAYPGYPGELLQDPETGASYNMEGQDGKKFLVPWIWNPVTLSCSGQP